MTQPKPIQRDNLTYFDPSEGEKVTRVGLNNIAKYNSGTVVADTADKCDSTYDVAVRPDSYSEANRNNYECWSIFQIRETTNKVLLEHLKKQPINLDDGYHTSVETSNPNNNELSSQRAETLRTVMDALKKSDTDECRVAENALGSAELCVGKGRVKVTVTFGGGEILMEKPQVPVAPTTEENPK